VVDVNVLPSCLRAPQQAIRSGRWSGREFEHSFCRYAPHETLVLHFAEALNRFAASTTGAPNNDLLWVDFIGDSVTRDLLRNLKKALKAIAPAGWEQQWAHGVGQFSVGHGRKRLLITFKEWFAPKCLHLPKEYHFGNTLGLVRKRFGEEVLSGFDSIDNATRPQLSVFGFGHHDPKTGVRSVMRWLERTLERFPWDAETASAGKPAVAVLTPLIPYSPLIPCKYSSDFRWRTAPRADVFQRHQAALVEKFITRYPGYVMSLNVNAAMLAWGLRLSHKDAVHLNAKGVVAKHFTSQVLEAILSQVLKPLSIPPPFAHTNRTAAADLGKVKNQIPKIGQG